MSSVDTNNPVRDAEPPAMGERRARMGYTAQDHLAAGLILEALHQDTQPAFVSVRLADLEGGQVDDFVLVWEDRVEGNSVKWTEEAPFLTWADLCGATEPLIEQLGAGWLMLKQKWPGRQVHVYLRTNKPASTSTHKNQLLPVSVASVIEQWEQVRQGTVAIDTDDKAWQLIQDRSGVPAEQFAAFVRSCHLLTGQTLPFHASPSSRDAQEWQREFDALRQAINDWVAKNPQQADFPRNELIQAVSGREVSARLVHRFPESEIGYEENEASMAALRSLISRTSGGYIALVGPAGAGKSTLAQKAIETHFYGVPYFAFLPGGKGDPRERGDALAFYTYVVQAMDRWESSGSTLLLSDLAHARERFAEQMRIAQERYSTRQQKTIILIDGLDHVTREEGLPRPLYQELPLPADVPDGCIILLGTQPQALTKLRMQIRQQVEKPERQLQISPLLRESVYRCLSSERIGHDATAEEKDTAYRASAGIPLFLTYIVKALQGNPNESVTEILERIGSFMGDAEDYYEERFATILDAPEYRKLLALLCRIRGRVQTDWLYSWPEWESFEKLYSFQLKAYFQYTSTHLSFLHNSLVAYLQRKTLPAVPGLSTQRVERDFYKELATRCTENNPRNVLARDRVYYLVWAGEHERVLQTVSQAWFREAAASFVPPNELASLAFLCMRSANTLADRGAFLALLASLKEIEHREIHARGEDLAKLFLDLGMPERAIEHVTDGAQLWVDETEALRFCRRLARWASHEQDPASFTAARRIFDMAKPINLLLASGPVDWNNFRHEADRINEWARAAAYFLPCSDANRLIENIQISGMNEEWDGTAESKRDRLRLEFTREVLKWGEPDEAAETLSVLMEPGSSMRFYALLDVASAQTDVANSSQGIISALKGEANDDSSRLLIANFLLGIEDTEGAKELITGIRCPVPSASAHDWKEKKLSRNDFVFLLGKIQSAVGLPLTPPPDPIGKDGEASARALTALFLCGTLYGIQDLLVDDEGLRQQLRNLLCCHQRRIKFNGLGNFRHDAEGSRRRVYELLLDLAQHSYAVAQALTAAFRETLTTAGPVVLNGFYIQLFAVKLFRAGCISLEEAKSLLQGATDGTEDSNTATRTTACFDMARAYNALGAANDVASWISKAGKAVHGISDHKDYQMIAWADWLDKSLPVPLNEGVLSVLQLAVRSLEVGGGRGGEDAARTIIQSCFRRNPQLGSDLGFEMIEREQLDLDECLAALLIAGATAKASPALLEALCVRLYLLIAARPNADAIRAVIESRQDAGSALVSAAKCIQAIRVNTVVGQRRIAARGVRDGLLSFGVTPPDYESALPPDDERTVDSSWLYKLSDGTVRTVAEVGRCLSNADAPEQWDPNPQANSSFAWHEAVAKANISSVEHLEEIERRFTPPHWSRVAMMVSLSRAALQLGRRDLASDFANQAYMESGEGGWIRYTGEAKRVAFERLVALDRIRWLPVAQKSFEEDIEQKNISTHGLLPVIGEIFDLLEWEWPKDRALEEIISYLQSMTAGTVLPAEYNSLISLGGDWTPDEALCGFLVSLLGHPVAAVALGAREVLADYTATGGLGLLRPLATLSSDATIVWEHVLISLHTAMQKNAKSILAFADTVSATQSSKSLAVRAVAYRIMKEAMLSTLPATKKELPLVYRLFMPPDTQTRDLIRSGARELTTSPLGAALEFYTRVFRWASRLSGIPVSNLRARASQLYKIRTESYVWTRAGEHKVTLWEKGALTNQYTRPSISVARDTAMWVLAELFDADLLDQSALVHYNAIAPLYDSLLEGETPQERPSLLVSFKRDEEPSYELPNFTNMRESLAFPPVVLDSQLVIAEASTFRSAIWEQPKQERLVVPALDKSNNLLLESAEATLQEDVAMTRQEYVELQCDSEALILRGVKTEPLLMWSNWLAVNPIVASRLGWYMADDGLFRWCNSSGEIMIESLWWRDGWLEFRPVLATSAQGEGWLVVCAPTAFDTIINLYGPLKQVSELETRMGKEDRAREFDERISYHERPLRFPSKQG